MRKREMNKKSIFDAILPYIQAKMSKILNPRISEAI